MVTFHPPLNSLSPHSDTLFSFSASTRWCNQQMEVLTSPIPFPKSAEGRKVREHGERGMKQVQEEGDKGKCENDTWKCQTTKDGNSCDRWNFTNHLLLRVSKWWQNFHFWCWFNIVLLCTVWPWSHIIYFDWYPKQCANHSLEAHSPDCAKAMWSISATWLLVLPPPTRTRLPLNKLCCRNPLWYLLPIMPIVMLTHFDHPISRPVQKLTALFKWIHENNS